MPATDPHYALVPGLEVVPLDGDALLLRSDTRAMRLEGNAASTVRDELVPRLRGAGAALTELQASVSYADPSAVAGLLEQLVVAGAVRRVGPTRGAAPTLATFEALLAQFGYGAEALSFLRDARIGILGVDGGGAYVAQQLQALGVRAIRLLDPFPVTSNDLALIPGLPASTLGVPRATAIMQALHTSAHTSQTHIQSATEPLTKAGVAAFVGATDVVISSMDRGFAAANVWLNRAAWTAGKPAVYSQLFGHRALVGPLVVPTESACYMCWRMRAIACEPDFDSAMRYEEWLDRQKRATGESRAVLPGLPHYVGGMITADVVKMLTGLGPPSLVGIVHEFDGLTFTTRAHPVLAVPDCPACGSAGEPSTGPNFEALKADREPRGDLARDAAALVSPLSGIVRELERVYKDPTEPEVPNVFRAQLANRHFHAEAEARYWVCSGKGMDEATARIGALGEAVERYSGFAWTGERLRRSTWSQLDVAAIDPRALVLFAPDQYATVPYAPYADSTEFGWVRGRDLVGGGEILVPAVGVLMDYRPLTHAEHIAPITSNGLGAGSSLLEAVLAGANEVLERDAFVINWLNLLPARRVDPRTHPDSETVGICSAYQRRGVTIELFRLPTDHPCCVYLALAVSERSDNGPAAITGLGADMSPAIAARRAILEVGQVRPALRNNLRRTATQERLQKLVEDPTTVTDLDDHDLLYASPQMLPAFDFLRSQVVESEDWSVMVDASSSGKLEVLVGWFTQRRIPLIYCDLTPPELRRLRLFAARVIIPDFQPIYFGERERRLGGRRLFELPRQLGFAQAARSIELLNRFPHPLA